MGLNYHKLMNWLTRYQQWVPRCITLNPLQRWLWAQTKFGAPSYFSSLDKPPSWDIAAHEAHPTLYWITHDGFTIIENFLNVPARKYYNLASYCRMRFIKKTHLIDTGFEPGEWYSAKERVSAAIWGEFLRNVEFRAGESKHLTPDEAIAEQERILDYLTNKDGWQYKHHVEVLAIYRWHREVRIPYVEAARKPDMAWQQELAERPYVTRFARTIEFRKEWVELGKAAKKDRKNKTGIFSETPTPRAVHEAEYLSMTHRIVDLLEKLDF